MNATTATEIREAVLDMFARQCCAVRTVTAPDLEHPQLWCVEDRNHGGQHQDALQRRWNGGVR